MRLGTLLDSLMSVVFWVFGFGSIRSTLGTPCNLTSLLETYRIVLLVQGTWTGSEQTLQNHIFRPHPISPLKTLQTTPIYPAWSVNKVHFEDNAGIFSLYTPHFYSLGISKYWNMNLTQAILTDCVLCVWLVCEIDLSYMLHAYPRSTNEAL
jgi:hypothetical protein